MLAVIRHLDLGIQLIDAFGNLLEFQSFIIIVIVEWANLTFWHSYIHDTWYIVPAKNVLGCYLLAFRWKCWWNLIEYKNSIWIFDGSAFIGFLFDAGEERLRKTYIFYRRRPAIFQFIYETTHICNKLCNGRQAKK